VTASSGLGATSRFTDARALPFVETGPSQGGGAFRRACADLGAALVGWRLWTFLANQEIRARYRRSTLGPLWLTLSMGVQIGAMGLVWGALFNLDARSFIPYLTLGILVWGLITGVVGEGATCFVHAAGYITQTRRPLSTYAFQLVCRNLLVAAHTLIVYVAAALIFRVTPSPAMVLAVPGLVLFVLGIAWTPLLLGPLGARFRDIPQVIQSALLVVFFVTPVMWRADMLGQRAYIATMNPLTHLIAIVRQPLLGEIPPAISWAVAVATAVLGWTAALLVFSRARSRIPYWL
jgi:lipopolysaccharide transport system permease protein